MQRLTSFALALCVTALVAGCQLALPGSGGRAEAEADVTPNAVTGDAIEVTALDPAPLVTDASGLAAAAPPASAGSAAPQGADPALATAVETLPAPQPELAPAVPENAKPEMQLACEKKGGIWSRAGSGSLRTCIYRTRDAGKRCTRESQCEGMCLARSGTCSPLKPLLGCNEILQDNGARVTLCIE